MHKEISLYLHDSVDTYTDGDLCRGDVKSVNKSTESNMDLSK